MYKLTTERIMKAPATIVWDVISDVERYADYAANLSKAIKTSDGTNPSRRCWDVQERHWDEECVLWRDGEVYSYEVDTTAPDYPYPFSYLRGTWGMEQTTAGIRVYMIFEYIPKPPLILGWLVHQAVRRQFKPTVDNLMKNWEIEITRRINISAA